MNIEQIITIGMQLPIVVLFIWYSERKDKQFLEFLREERQAREKQTDITTNKLTALDDTINSFHAEVTTAIRVMQDRTSTHRQ